MALQTEIEIIKQIDHPNVVKVLDVQEDDKYVYIVMEMLKGGEVRKILAFTDVLVVRPHL